MSFMRVYPVDTSNSRESACARYYERFCERAKKELLIADGVQSIVRLERSPQRPAVPRLEGAHGLGVDSKSNLVPGMRVSQKVIDAARVWATISPDKRRLQPGLAERLAVEVGVARGTLTRVGRRILKGDL